MIWMSLLGFIVVILLMVGAVRVAEVYKKELPTKGEPGNNRRNRRHKRH